MHATRLLALLAGTVLITTTSAATVTFEDIQYWVGSGANEAAFVVDWNAGPAPQSLVWGYRWDGAATGEDMLTAIVTADPNLYVKVSGFGGGLGVALFGVGYDRDGDGFGLTDGTVFSDGIANTAASDGETALDSDDSYVEGWFSAGFWSYWLSEDGTTWGFSGTGMSGRTLTDGSWDGWSFAPSFGSSAPSTPTPAIPEPATLVLLGVGMGIAFRRR